MVSLALPKGFVAKYCVVVAAAALVLAGPASGAADAARRRHHRAYHSTRRARVRRVVAAPPFRAALLEDADTGRVLYAVNPELQWPPASMAKMMLLLVAADQIRAGRAQLDDPVRISRRAARTGGSHVLLSPGEVVPLGDLMKAALIQSANNAAVAVAERIAGSVEACVRMMNERARRLGLTHTRFATVNGLPPRPGHDVDVTDARDLAALGRALIRETNLLQWSSQSRAGFMDGRVILRNTNHLVGVFPGCDGLKTGYTFKSGFNLTATARRGNLRLLAVVLGAPTNRQRFAQAARLLDWGFEHFAKLKLFQAGELLPVFTQVGPGQLVQPVAETSVEVLVAREDLDRISLDYDVPASVAGPLLPNMPLGQVVVRVGERVLARAEAISALAPVAGAGARSLSAVLHRSYLAPPGAEELPAQMGVRIR